MEQIAKPEYHIGGGTYRMEPLSWQQSKWLGEYIFKDIDMQRLDYGTIHDLLRDKGPLMMAICLIDVGMTRAEHSKLSWSTISQRADDFSAELTGEEVALFGPHFFQFCRPGSMAMLVPGRVLQSLFDQEAKRPPAPGADGSSGVSSLSPAATLPSSASSLPSGGQPSLIRISDGASSESASTAPSLVGAASSSHG